MHDVKRPRMLSMCIQCRDRISNRIGDFIHKGDFIAISPVFQNLVSLFTWMKVHGYGSVPGSHTEVREVAHA
jgi:hypothetical protein